MFDYTVKDSSLWRDFNSISSRGNSEMSIRIGMVQEEVYNGIKDETHYMVDVLDNRGQHLIPCTRMVRFGSPYNYEEYTRQTYDIEEGDIAARGELRFRPGEVVVVAILMGGNAEGIILGSMNHPYRSETLKRNNEVAYVSEFNGIEEYISKDGEWRQTFRGIQTNVADLRKAPNGTPIPEPIYNKDITGSYMEWDKTGSWHVTDNSLDDLSQFIKIDKKEGKLSIVSGKTDFIINKKDESYAINNKKTTLNSIEEIIVNTKKSLIKSQDLFELVAESIKTKGKFLQEGDLEIKGNIKVKGDLDLTGKTKLTGDIDQSGNTKINGNFETSGQTKLAGGANALLVDIVMIQGVGNLGAPVISNAIVLKTVMTKAT